MSADSATAYDVHLGAWTDWSGGPVFGAKLTLTRQDGSLLIAFLAFFVAIVGTRFWRLACLVLHYVYSREDDHDGVHHQRHNPNAPNPESALWTVADIGFSWRDCAKKVWARLFLITGLAIACVVGFALAGGFSSRIATVFGHEVLLSGANCGLVAHDNGLDSFSDTEGPKLTGELMAAENYARQCYTSSTIKSVSCSTFVRSQLPPALVDTNASCPFDAKICKKSWGNLLIDTGFLDSHYDFGRNTPPNQRLQYRRRVHCAPLATENYRFRTYDDIQNQSYTTYYYGRSQNVNGSTNNYTTQFSNAMYSYPDVEEITRYGGDTMNDLSVRYVCVHHILDPLNSSQCKPF